MKLKVNDWVMMADGTVGWVSYISTSDINTVGITIGPKEYYTYASSLQIIELTFKGWAE